MAKSKIKYPSWFNSYYAPGPAPVEPKNNIQEFEVLARETGNNRLIDLSNYPGATHIYIECNYERSYYDSIECDAEITIQKQLSGPDPNHEKKLEKYKREKKKYNAKLAQWIKWKKIYDEEQEANDLEQKKVLFKKLKKELGL